MEKLIYKKMSAVMKEIGSIGKDQRNTQQNFAFRGIDQFINALHPLLTKHGVFVAPECTAESHELKDVTRSSGKAGVDKHVSVQMKYHFYAEDGSSVTVGPLPAEGLDSGDKATNKALSSALKYALIQTFFVPTEDMAEADSESPEIGASNAKSLSPTAPAKSDATPSGASTAVAPAISPAGATASLAPKGRTTFRRNAVIKDNATTTGATDDGWAN